MRKIKYIYFLKSELIELLWEMRAFNYNYWIQINGLDYVFNYKSKHYLYKSHIIFIKKKKNHINL